jgi:hypothetical protein
LAATDDVGARDAGRKKRKEGGGQGAAGACFGTAVSLPPVKVTTAAVRAARKQVETEVKNG